MARSFCFHRFWIVPLVALVVTSGCKKKHLMPAHVAPEPLAHMPSPVSSLPLPSPSSAVSAPSARQQDPILKGLECLYNLHYDQARKTFDEQIQTHPKDPAGYFYRAAASWWEIAQNYGEGRTPAEALFVQDYHRTMKACDRLSQSRDKKEKARAYLYEGGAEGLRGRLLVTRSDWVKAYFAGKHGAEFLHHALREDPTLEDAKLGLGIYDYYTDTLGGVQKALAALLVHGNRKRGIEELMEASQKGKYARVEAKLFLIDVYTGHENTPTKALPLARELRQQFPQSPAMHVILIRTLHATRQWVPMMQEAKDFLQKSEKGIPYYRAEDIPAAHYFMGLAALDEGNTQQCIGEMDTILQSSGLSTRWKAFAYLRRGQALDLLQKRKAAEDDYKCVLSMRDIWGSHEEAHHYLKDPYSFRKY